MLGNLISSGILQDDSVWFLDFCRLHCSFGFVYVRCVQVRPNIFLNQFSGFKFIACRYCLKNAHLEFDIAWNTMQIIYNQTLFWVGLVFSPLLPAVVVVKLLLTWYIRYSTVIYLCKPSAKTWRAAQTSTWFLVMTFLSLLCIGGLVGYIIS